MKKVIGIIIISTIGIFLYLGIARTQQSEEVLSIAKIQKKEGVPINVATVSKGNLKEVRRFYGDVKGAQETVVSSKLMQPIDNILVEMGDFVRKDQPIVLFDSSSSQASVIQSGLALDNAKKDYNRAVALIKEGAISQQALDGLKVQYDVAQENYKMARSAIILLAPSSGRVARMDMKAGDLAMPGMPIMIIVKEKVYAVEFDVTREDRIPLKAKQPITVYGSNHEVVEGHIVSASSATLPDSRMFKIYGEIPAVDFLFPGNLVAVDVRVGERDGVLVVPTSSVLKKNSVSQVMVIENNIAKIKKVTTGLSAEERVEIISGLTLGEQVAVYGHLDLVDGQKVKVIE